MKNGLPEAGDKLLDLENGNGELVIERCTSGHHTEQEEWVPGRYWVWLKDRYWVLPLDTVLPMIHAYNEKHNEWAQVSPEDMWNEIQEIRKLTGNDGTCSPSVLVRALMEELGELRTRFASLKHVGWTWMTGSAPFLFREFTERMSDQKAQELQAQKIYVQGSSD